jgi:hypothetical protein
MALDVAGGKMYWSDYGTNYVQRANLDGTGVETLVTGLGNPRQIALDLSAGKMYWSDNGTDKIQRANLDGTSVEDLIVTSNAFGIALDVAAGKMYWTDKGIDKIQRANLDLSSDGWWARRQYVTFDITGGTGVMTGYSGSGTVEAVLDYTTQTWVQNTIIFDLPDVIEIQGAGGSTGTSHSIDIGQAGNDRLVVVIADDESSGTSLTNVTVDGKNCTKVTEADNPVGIGNHQEMWYILESGLGSSSGVVDCALSGGDGGWAIHVLVFYNVKQQGPTDFQIDNTSAAQFEILPGVIDIPGQGLVVFGAANGQSGSYNDLDWDTSPTEGTDDGQSPEIEMTEVTDGPNPGSAVFATAYWISTIAAQTNRQFRARGNVANNRGTGIIATWEWKIIP